jgi:hypothetical protein
VARDPKDIIIMFSRSSLLRTAAAATMTCAMAAAPAVAREDVPPAPAPAATGHVVAKAQRALPPRVDGMGVKPVAPAARPDAPEVAAAVPVGLVSPASPHGTGDSGLDWLSAAIGALALLAALLTAVVVRTSSAALHRRRVAPPVA